MFNKKLSLGRLFLLIILTSSPLFLSPAAAVVHPRLNPASSNQKKSQLPEYQPPEKINYGNRLYPVYQNKPPDYVYEYKNSGSKFHNLLTGLALYNLGRMSSHREYTQIKSNQSNILYFTPKQTVKYRENKILEAQNKIPGLCKLAIKKRNGEYQTVKIDCKLLSSFIWEEKNSVDSSDMNVIMRSVKDKRAINALEQKGRSITVSPGMSCIAIWVLKDSAMWKKEECGLFEAYALRSFVNNQRKTKKKIIQRCVGWFCAWKN